MTTRLVVEVDDLVDVSRSMYDDVAGPLDVAVGRLTDTLLGCSAMAGSDEAGVQWSASYDPAAATTQRAIVAAMNGSYRLSAMFAQTSRNYAAAEAASTAGVRRAVDADLARLPWPTSMSLPMLPSAEGGSGGGPPGWSLVQHAVGYVWPNGHQDVLHRAGDAWTVCAAALEEAGTSALLAPIRLFVDGLPEYDDMHTVCTAMWQHLRALAGACRSLARACRELAQHIDEVHSEVEHQLRDLAAQSVGLQIIGGILGAATAGAAEVPTQGLQLSRITAVGEDIGRLIAKFIVLAKDAIAELPAVHALTDRISLVLERLQSSKLAIAGMDAVPNLPGAARAARLAKTPEVRAADRLTSEANGLPAKLAGRRPGDPGIWGNRRTLAKHVRDHARGVGATSEADYVKRASDLLDRAIRDGLPRKVDARDGTIRVYDPATKLFGSYRADGSTRSFYKLGKNAAKYWAEQDGVLQ